MQNAQNLPDTLKHDHAKEAMSIRIRDTLHNLDLTYKANTKIYDEHKLEYIALFEGKESKAYDDEFKDKDYKYVNQLNAVGKEAIGNITIGYGFNMDSPGAKDEWGKVFKD